MRRILVLVAFASVIAAAACNGLLGVEDRPLRPDDSGIVEVPHDASTEDSTRPDGNGVPPDASVDAGTDAAIDARSPCPSDAGPTMVLSGTVCIDSTEVTRAQYLAFLASNPTVASAGADCAFKASFVPSSGWPPAAGTESLPVIFVDWCDATAYCKWAGKRVCGARAGGPLQTNQGGSTTSQWYYACSNDGLRGFPYGTTFDAKSCNGIEREAGAPIPPATLATCDAGFGGLFDMAGNVQEWFDGCDRADAATREIGRAHV